MATIAFHLRAGDFEGCMGFSTHFPVVVLQISEFEQPQSTHERWISSHEPYPSHRLIKQRESWWVPLQGDLGRGTRPQSPFPLQRLTIQAVSLVEPSQEVSGPKAQDFLTSEQVLLQKFWPVHGSPAWPSQTVSPEPESTHQSFPLQNTPSLHQLPTTGRDQLNGSFVALQIIQKLVPCFERKYSPCSLQNPRMLQNPGLTWHPKPGTQLSHSEQICVSSCEMRQDLVR